MFARRPISESVARFKAASQLALCLLLMRLGITSVFLMLAACYTLWIPRRYDDYSVDGLRTRGAETEHSMVAVNLRGTFLTAFEAAKRIRRDGRLILISSGLAARPMAGTAVYSATKAAIDAMAVSLSKELGERGITVNSVQPGATVPGMFEQSGEEAAEAFAALSPFGRLGHPDDIAEAVSFLAGDSGRWLTGQTVRVDGGSMK